MPDELTEQATALLQQLLESARADAEAIARGPEAFQSGLPKIQRLIDAIQSTLQYMREPLAETPD